MATYFTQASLSLLILLSVYSCKKDSTSSGNNSSNAAVPEVYKKIYGATSISTDGNFITIKVDGVPDHKSIYYPAGNALYENFSGTTFKGTTFSKNPNSIAAQYFTFKIPVNPTEASTKQATPLGPHWCFHQRCSLFQSICWSQSTPYW